MSARHHIRRFLPPDEVHHVVNVSIQVHVRRQQMRTVGHARQRRREHVVPCGLQSLPDPLPTPAPVPCAVNQNKSSHSESIVDPSPAKLTYSFTMRRLFSLVFGTFLAGASVLSAAISDPVRTDTGLVSGTAGSTDEVRVF